MKKSFMDVLDTPTEETGFTEDALFNDDVVAEKVGDSDSDSIASEMTEDDEETLQGFFQDEDEEIEEALIKDDAEEEEKAEEEQEEIEAKKEEQKDDSKNEDLVEIPGWAKKLQEQYPDREFKSFEDFDQAMEEHLAEMQTQMESYATVQERLKELNVANPGFDKFIDALEQGDSLVVAAMKAGITPEDFEVYDEEEKDAEAKILAKHEAKRRKDEAVKAQKQIQDNIDKSSKILDDFTKERKIAPDEKDVIIGKINDFVTNVTQGKLTKDLIEFIYKGARYDKDKEKAEETGYIRGRNAKFQVEKKKREGDGVAKISSISTTRKENVPQTEDDEFVSGMSAYASRRSNSFIDRFQN